jgi:hypothetical protein
LLASLSGGKAKHSNTCFMASKLVRSATPVKEDHSFLSLSLLLLYLFNWRSAAKKEKSLRPLLKRHRFSPHAPGENT